MDCIAFDLGSSSGKMALGRYCGERLEVLPLYRFDNRQISMNGGLYWDFTGIYHHLLQGLQKALGEGCAPQSIGMDSFSNDFGFVSGDGALISQVRCYRDQRTARCAEIIYQKLSRECLHAMTGNQNALFNTVIQLAAMAEEGQDYFFQNGNTMLLFPDLLGFMLTGEKRSEYTVSSVTQMFDYEAHQWHGEVLEAFGIPRELLAPITMPGSVLGELLPGVQRETGAGSLQVVSVCEHDTASAVAALPTNEPDVVFISSGTWSLFGTELLDPIVNQDTFRQNFALEGGVDCRFRLLKNIMGLWLVQECRLAYRREGKDYSYLDLEELSQQAPGFQSIVDPDDPLFYMPGDMPGKIAQRCAETGQPVPQTPGETLRCVTESLALKYRWALDWIQRITGRKMKGIYILGGGGQNSQLNQFAASACGIPVYAGVHDAAICGNLLMQLRAAGELNSLAQGRLLMERSFPLVQFDPVDTPLWEEQYQAFMRRYQPN